MLANARAAQSKAIGVARSISCTGAGVSRKLSLPNMLAAAARYGFGRLLLGQLRFADGAGFSHHVSHDLYSLAESLDGVSGFHV